MIINEAIEILTILESRSINNSLMFKKDALKLGIEALKDKKFRRVTMYPFNQDLLPGETEE